MLCRAAQSVAVPGATPTVSLIEANQLARFRSSQKSLARCSAQGAGAAEGEADALSKLAPGSAASCPALGSACTEISLCLRRRALSCCWRKTSAASWRSPSGVRSKMHATANISWGPSSRLACRRHFCANVRRWRCFSRLNAAIAARCCCNASTDMAFERGTAVSDKRNAAVSGGMWGSLAPAGARTTAETKATNSFRVAHRTHVSWHDSPGANAVGEGRHICEICWETDGEVCSGWLPDTSNALTSPHAPGTVHADVDADGQSDICIEPAGPAMTHGSAAAEQLAGTLRLHLVRRDLQCVAKCRFADSCRRRLARRDQAILPEARSYAMVPDPGRPPTRPRSGSAAPIRSCVCRGSSPSPFCITQRSDMSAYDSPWGTPSRTRRHSPRTHITSMSCFLPYPHARRKKAQSFAGCTVPVALGPARCRSTTQAPPAQTAMRSRFGSTCTCRVQFRTRQVLPQRGYNSRFQHVTRWTFGVSGCHARQPLPVHSRQAAVRCHAGFHTAIAGGPGTREPGPEEIGSRGGGGLRASTAQGHSVLCGVCYQPPSAGGTGKHTTLSSPSLQMTLWGVDGD